MLSFAGHARTHRLSWRPGDLVHVVTEKEETEFRGPHFPFEVHQADLSDFHDTARDVHRDDIASHAEHRHTFDSSHVGAIKSYKEHSAVNNVLRQRDTGMRGQISALDHVTSVPLQHPVHVWRGFGSEFPIHHLKPGHVFKDRGFVSTSHDFDVAANTFSHFHDFDAAEGPEGNPYEHHPLHGMASVAKIHLPNGTKSHILDHNDLPLVGLHNHEGEHLLARGSHFRVDRHEFASAPKNRWTPLKGYHVVHMSLVHQDPSA